MRNLTKKISMIMMFFAVFTACFYMNEMNVKAESSYWDEYGVLHASNDDINSVTDEECYNFLKACGCTDAEAQEIVYGSSENSTTSESSTSSITSNNITSESAQIDNATNDNLPAASVSETKKTSKTTTSTTPAYTQEQIDAAWVETNRVEATCANTGSITYTNSITGETKSEEIPATSNHDYVESDRTEATCDVDGCVTYTCSVCDDSYTETISATGHTADAPVVTKTAGLFSDGEQTVSCSECDTVLSTTVIPHKANATLAVIFALVFLAAVVAVATFVAHKKKLSLATEDE